MKEKAHEKGLKMFLKAKGAIRNQVIADAVDVSPMTVSRWKKRYGWAEALESHLQNATKGKTALKKQAHFDKAFKLFSNAGGNITNQEMARKVGVMPATIAKWRKMGEWDAKVKAPATKTVEPEPPQVVPAAEEKPMEKRKAAEKTDRLDIRRLSSPEQLIRINEMINKLLEREHLSAAEIAGLARAKRDVIDAVDLYVSIESQLSESE